MRKLFQFIAAMLALSSIANAETNAPSTEEFGLSKKELVQAVEKVEALIAQCMLEEGFEYVAADFNTIRKGMAADKVLPGMDEEEFAEQYGLGLATLYTGTAPQLAEGYSPGKVGLGERNVQIFQNLSPASQVAYNRALFGENTDATHAVALEIENFSRCGGCTLKAINQVFNPDQMKATYSNPLDLIISKDVRMKAALRKYSNAMRDAGFDYTHPDEVEPDIRERLHSITAGGTIPAEKLPPDQMTALKELQEVERRVAVLTIKLEEKYFEPVEEQIEREMFSYKVD